MDFLSGIFLSPIRLHWNKGDLPVGWKKHHPPPQKEKEAREGMARYLLVYQRSIHLAEVLMGLSKFSIRKITHCSSSPHYSSPNPSSLLRLVNSVHSHS